MTTYSHKNQKILNRDRETFKAMAKCHYLAKEHFDRMNFSNKSIDRYLRTGVIEAVEKIDRHSNDTVILYKLTDYGKGWCEREVFDKRESYYSSTGHEHDLRIADVYTDLYQQGIKFDWKTEKDLQQEFRDRIEEIREHNPLRAMQIERDYSEGAMSAPDFAYTTSNQTVMVEVITNSGTYTESHLEAKEAFGEVLGSSVHFIK